VVPNGVDVDRHTVLQHHDDHGATAAWLGLMQPVKRVPRLVRVLADVPDLRLRLVGDGPLRSAVEAMVVACDVADRVDLVGFHPDGVAALDGTDLLVLPSAAEACPMAVLQAMARGLPVVASAAGGVPEIVRDGVEGLLVPAGDDDALRHALHLLAKDPGLRRELGAAARRRVRARFTIGHTTRRLVEVYRQVAR
jgi:glycosyltransferase involved in cell wall biosynthesis